MSVATPGGYGPRAEILEKATELAGVSEAKIEIVNDPVEAVESAHAVYTDVWASMGQEAEAEERKKLFVPYQVNEALLADARKDTLFMHCLPAKRGLEVADVVMV